MLRVTVGLKLDGAALVEVDECGGVGRPAWGPVGLLRDLEMRLGLAAGAAAGEAAAVRVHQWSARLAALLGTEPFYARSYRVDPLGTAEMTIAWRDGLIESGWEGTQVPGGGARLATFAALEELAALPLLPGAADRLAAVEVETALATGSPYGELVFADEPGLWPYRWQRIFELLAERGTRMGRVTVNVPGDGVGDEPTDLQRLQGLVAAGATAAERMDLRGDGSLVLLRAATSLEAADAVAAMVRAAEGASVAIVRPAQAGILDDALATHGASTLGTRPASPWRAPLQVLPLALEMVFEPCDPRRALELLGLAVSPFACATRYAMARALRDSPGIGGAVWLNEKRRLRKRLAALTAQETSNAAGHEGLEATARLEGDGADPAAATGGGGLDAGASSGGPKEAAASHAAPEAAARADREVALLEAWMEPPRYDAREGVPKAVIVDVGTRVRDWLRGRIVGGAPRPAVAAAIEQCRQVLEIVASDPRERFDLLAVRQVLDAVTASGALAELAVEQAGRADHVDHPGALLRARDLVVWWHFVADTTRPPHRARWRKTELDALAACGVVPADPAALLAEETRQWRSAVLAARRRLVLVMPETDRGERTAPHPLWDEVVARLRLDDVQIAKATVTVGALRARTNPMLDLEVEPLARLSLPPARPTWNVPAGLIGAAARLTPASLQELLECPLRWVLGHAAGAGGSSVPTLPEGPLFNGGLGHRLVSALIDSGGLARPREALVQAFDEIVSGAAAALLQPGMTFELQQLRHQIVGAVASLAALVERGEMSIVATEEKITGQWLGAELDGRLDLRLLDRSGREVILDLKWGLGTYRPLLTEGRMVQLAVYAQARKLQTGAALLPAGAYFSLSRGRLMATDLAPFGTGRDGAGDVEGAERVTGITLDETLARITASVPAVQRSLADGTVHVTGVARSLPLLDALGIPGNERSRHYQCEGDRGCKHCPFDVLCGRKWKAWA